MNILVTCVKCGRVYKVPNNYKGEFEVKFPCFCDCMSNTFTFEANLTFPRKMIHGIIVPKEKP